MAKKKASPGTFIGTRVVDKKVNVNKLPSGATSTSSTGKFKTTSSPLREQPTVGFHSSRKSFKDTREKAKSAIKKVKGK